MSEPDFTLTDADDRDLGRIARDEEQCLGRVRSHLEERAARPKREEKPTLDYDAELLSLRDQIAAARMEDVPPLLEQMERLQSVAGRKRESTELGIDPRSPYFGRLVLKEGERQREVLIGRGTYLDTRANVRIVDWRDAPVSRLFYRYEEGDDYDEVFGDKEVSGEVITRRSVTIVDQRLRRISSPQGSFAKSTAGAWRRIDSGAAHLRGGAGTATRIQDHHRPGKLGVRGADEREDKHLKEITAMIDARQFELITRPESGLVVIQGGAGSGKTTIGLHRLAYLAYADRHRFRPDRVLVLVFNDALARYVSLVLPALDVQGITIKTYADLAAKLRALHAPRAPRRYHDETPTDVTRLKKHPAMLRAIEGWVADFEARLEARFADARGRDAERGDTLLASWKGSAGRPVSHRLHSLSRWLDGEDGRALHADARLLANGAIDTGLRDARDVIGAWADLLSDRSRLERAFTEYGAQLGAVELGRAHAWCVTQANAVLQEIERKEEERAERRDAEEDAPRPRSTDEGEAAGDERGEDDEDGTGVDGRDLEEGAKIDREDDTLLLRLTQRLRGPLMRPGKIGKAKEAMVYEHVLVDEAQDMSPVELAVVLDMVSPKKSVTLAGDVAQRLHMDNGFKDWATLLGDLGMSHVEIEPLKLSYRSTEEIVSFSRDVLGPLADPDPPRAVRSGAPVEMLSFGHTGDAVAFLGEALRELSSAEPSASVAVIARFPEQADLYFDGLRKAEVPHVRRVADQDFAFRPGVDVTDVRQVKGLEFDYVILVEVGESAYPAEVEARHLLHIGATRAAHQLWVLVTGRPSPLLPASLVERSL